MIVIVDSRQIVVEGYTARFKNEGVLATGFGPDDCLEWLESAADSDLGSVEAILLGECGAREIYAKSVRSKLRAPVIALVDAHGLNQTLALFAAGVDDVVRKPVHVREILARVAAIRRRAEDQTDISAIGDMQIYFDGRDPTVAGEAFPLPRRERRILEYLAANSGRRVSKTQVFNAIYGVFDENIDETVVESHVSKLRKKLKTRLGFDPIDSRRHLGYCLEVDRRDRKPEPASRRRPAPKFAGYDHALSSA